MSRFSTISDIRREYGQLKLGEKEVHASPIAQFKHWFEESLTTETDDPTAMVCSTVDENGLPDSRVVLLKDVDEDAFVFYTNYLSTKGRQIQNNPNVALNFYWPKLVRQVRIRGQATRTTATQSDAYFSSRPIASQFAAILSLQSQALNSESTLEERLNKLMSEHSPDKPISRPIHWGGYAVVPDEMEFWQGRDNRLHDRIHYFRQDGVWFHRRLAP